ncbi:MAG: hypothetical protein JWO52_4061 [Gammaproteobacteria bacterium]|nr:hypothetical protein [Gammaproteobacteria bacterium]
MANKSNYYENYEIDGVFRGGALNSAGTVNSTAVVKGIWTATTAYVLGDIVVPHANMTGAGGKFLRCTTAGTTASTNTLAVPNPGTTLTDGTVTWTAISGMPSPQAFYMALFSINKGQRASSTAYVLNDVISLTANGGSGGDNKQHLYYCTTAGTTAASQIAANGGLGYPGVPAEAITDGTAVFTELSGVIDTGTGFPAGLTEIVGGSYARVKVAAGTVVTLTDWAGTQSAASTTSSTGSGGTTSNNSAVTFPAPTGNWANGSAQVGAAFLMDQLTGGNMWVWAPLTVPKSVSSGDAAPSFPAASFSFQSDN